MAASLKATDDPLWRNAALSTGLYRRLSDNRRPSAGTGSQVEDVQIDEAIINVLKAKKIDRLYKFQEEAIKKILQGKDVVITAPTASGKTEAFCIPLLQEVAEHLSRFGSLHVGKGIVSAIFIYPTKALSHDQLPKIRRDGKPTWCEGSGPRWRHIRKGAQNRDQSPPDVIITNFDVLHYHMMHKTKFSRMVRTAKFLVTDEAHVYTGIFGARMSTRIIARLEARREQTPDSRCIGYIAKCSRILQDAFWKADASSIREGQAGKNKPCDNISFAKMYRSLSAGPP